MKRRFTIIENNGAAFFQKNLSRRCIMTFYCVLLLISVVWMQYLLPWHILFLILTSSFIFFYGVNYYGKLWKNVSRRVFLTKLFVVAVLLRLCWVIYSYISAVETYGPIFYPHLEDVEFYVGVSEEAASRIADGKFDFIDRWVSVYGVNYDDLGYPLYLTLLYVLTGRISVQFFPLLSKTLYGTFTCILIYKMANRHFGESVARMSALFCALNPNLIWWSGSLMKETEMVFLTCWFAERMDGVLSKDKVTFLSLLPATIIGLYLMMFRAALGVLCFLAFFAAVVFANKKMVSTGKKVLAGMFVAAILFVGMGERLVSETQSMFSDVETGGQQVNMEWRATRKNGNSFAKYAGAAVFAPLIFTIPFPTLVYTFSEQESLMEVAGGNYIKNVLSFFVILAMFYLLFSGKWRRHIFPLAMMVGYLLILVMSVYAQSGRFHMPILPFEMMFAAYGFSLCGKRELRWFNYFLVLEFFICIGWQWFKLKGRGMI